jgi:hypothetical protein
MKRVIGIIDRDEYDAHIDGGSSWTPIYRRILRGMCWKTLFAQLFAKFPGRKRAFDRHVGDRT